MSQNRSRHESVVRAHRASSGGQRLWGQGHAAPPGQRSREKEPPCEEHWAPLRLTADLETLGTQAQPGRQELWSPPTTSLRGDRVGVYALAAQELDPPVKTSPRMAGPTAWQTRPLHVESARREKEEQR